MGRWIEDYHIEKGERRGAGMGFDIKKSSFFFMRMPPAELCNLYDLKNEFA
ncbi:hypothetical protein ACXYMT_05070 [Salinimicrobium sp. CAU 1759]